MVRRGFGDAAKRIQELYLAGHKDEAIASVPDEWVDLKSLVGPPARIRERSRDRRVDEVAGLQAAQKSVATDEAAVATEPTPAGDATTA